MREPNMGNPQLGIFEEYPETPEPIPLCVTVDTIETVAAKLSGGGGPSGTDAVDLCNWLLRFGAESEQLRQVIANLTNWLANDHPPWAAYRALMACCLVALDKQPGIRHVGIGEVYRRLMAKAVKTLVKPVMTPPSPPADCRMDKVNLAAKHPWE